MRILGNKTLEKDADRLSILIDGQALLSAKILKALGGSGGTPGLDVDNGVASANTDAKFGNAFPVYLIHAVPAVGFNAYYNGGWKFGKGSTAHYGGLLYLNHTNGNFIFAASNGSGAADGAITLVNLLQITQAGDVFTENRTQYSGTSTITGWSSRAFTSILYKKIGKLVYVWWEITGTSNATSTSFTLPYTNGMGQTAQAVCRVVDNGTSKVGLAHLPAGSNVLSFYTDMAASGWTASGTKTVYGEIFYEVA